MKSVAYFKSKHSYFFSRDRKAFHRDMEYDAYADCLIVRQKNHNDIGSYFTAYREMDGITDDLFFLTSARTKEDLKIKIDIKLVEN